MSCAGTNTIAALLAGAADASAAARLELHLDACSDCRRLVADLGRGLSAVGDHTRASLDDRLPRPGETIGRYEVRRVIGVGGMGVVYEAHDTTLDRQVAVKVLRPDLPDHASLIAEGRAMARLQHPNIVAVFDAGAVGNQLYVCMEYVSGSTARAWLTEGARDWRAITSLYVAAGQGLAYVHRAGLVHLDFKPDNVLVDRDGRVRVTDFGLARIAGRHDGILAGTPAYMAPEQRRGAATDARSDQFAFCATLREALGDRPAPRWLRSALARGVANDRRDRFASMDDLLAVLARGLAPARGRLATTALVGSFAVAASAAVALLPPQTRIVTTLVGGSFAAARGEGTARLEGPATTPPIVEQMTNAAAVRAAEGPVSSRAPLAELLTDARRASLRGRLMPALDVQPVAFNGTSAAPAADVTVADDSAPLGVAGLCDDGSARTCSLWPPGCPAGTLLAVQAGCWTCADVETCAPLGYPRTCNDGSRLRCTEQPPTCAGRHVAAVRNGCWSCEDAFTCYARSPSTKPPPHPERCGNHVCERGETHASCEVDCGADPNTGSGAGSGSGSAAGAVCGNGFCEKPEDHASCAADCCEIGADGACAAACGNGFCEAGEDHASCSSDCCETTPTGACLPVCGNGFCEPGESASTCSTDCR